MSPDTSSFSQQLIAWHAAAGRHDLPWQHTRDPYRIWLSEIMLQQTQVSAVIPYYLRFLERFPDLASLASAPQDDVLAHWSGLGYYARARNLHRAAQQIMVQHEGRFPTRPAEIQALPGIGRSTAAAIAAFAFGERAAILDGNVKRVLTRCFGIEGYPDQPRVLQRLWALAESLLPQANIEIYTQAMMDLGATLCVRGKPRCASCPLQQLCVAFHTQRTTELPHPKPRRPLPQREAIVLILQQGQEILLQKRPPQGIWGGLWSFPEVEASAVLAQHVAEHFGKQVRRILPLTALEHGFTHFRLTLRPLWVEVTPRKKSEEMMPGLVWLTLDEAMDAAIPTPVRKLLRQL